MDDTVRVELPFSGPPRLDVEATMATLVLSPVAAGDVPHVESRGRRADKARIDVRVENGVVFVRAQPVEADFTIEDGAPGASKIVLFVPADVRARVHTAIGRIHAERLAGCALDLETEAGRISLDDVQGTLTLRTQAGQIDGGNLSGRFDVQSSAGAVRLDVSWLDEGAHRVRTSLGAVRVDLARGMSVRIDARTTMGSSRIDYPSAPDARATLEVSADVGAIRVREASRTAAPPPATTPSGPYRTGGGAPGAGAPSPPPVSRDAQVEVILERVARGELSPHDASALLRELGR